MTKERLSIWYLYQRITEPKILTDQEVMSTFRHRGFIHLKKITKLRGHTVKQYIVLSLIGNVM